MHIVDVDEITKYHPEYLDKIVQAFDSDKKITWGGFVFRPTIVGVIVRLVGLPEDIEIYLSPLIEHIRPIVTEYWKYGRTFTFDY